jgi:hypothetical protein
MQLQSYTQLKNGLINMRILLIRTVTNLTHTISNFDHCSQVSRTRYKVFQGIAGVTTAVTTRLVVQTSPGRERLSVLESRIVDFK